MRDKQLYKIHADICKALTHPVRLEILDNLRDGEKTVSQLVARLGVTQSAVSRHLAIMRSYGVVQTRRDGTRIFYRIGNKHILAAYDEMHTFAVEMLTAQSAIFAPH